MAMTGQNCMVYQGNTHDMTIVVGTDGIPTDLTGYSASWVMYEPNTKQVVIQKTTVSGGGITIPNPLNGEILIELAPEDTHDLLQRVYNQQCNIMRDDEVYTVLTGTVSVIYSRL